MSQHPAEMARPVEGSVPAAFPIALLESMRSHDRPGEILQDEDLMISLPRRLGLTGVVETQIARYETARRAGRAVRLDEVIGLVRLVMRRPDSEPILRETGQRLARWQFRRTPDLWQAVLHRAPAAFALRSARRASTRALESLAAGSHIHADKPFTITVRDCATAGLPEGAACTLFGSMFEELLLLHTGQARMVVHVRCGGDEGCEWTVG